MIDYELYVCYTIWKKITFLSGQDETRRSWVKVDDIKRHEVDGSKNESRQSKINSSRRPLFTDSKIKKKSILIWNFSL